jgi:hypothetical protein
MFLDIFEHEYQRMNVSIDWIVACGNYKLD